MARSKSSPMKTNRPASVGGLECWKAAKAGACASRPHYATTPTLQFSLLAWLFLSTLNPQLSTCLAQGDLTPPGPPGQTMKSLDQIEARIIVNSSNTPGDTL